MTEHNPNRLPPELLKHWLRCTDCESEAVDIAALPPIDPLPGIELINTLRCYSCGETDRGTTLTQKAADKHDLADRLGARRMIGMWLKCPGCGDRDPTWIDWRDPGELERHWRLTCEGCGYDEHASLGWREMTELEQNGEWLRL